MKQVTIYVLVSVLVGLLVGAGVGWLSKPAVEVPVTVTAPGVTVTETVAGPTVTTTVTPEVPVGLTGEVKIGYIDDLTGPGAFWGEQHLVAAEIAVEEVNKYLDETGAGWWIKLYVEDSECKPEVALDKLKSLHALGITIVTGDEFSADLKAMMAYANTNKILLLATGNSYELAVEGDYLFRVLPNSATSGVCIAALLRELGIEYEIFVWAGHAYGDSLVHATRERCEELGIEMDEGIRYDPAAVEFSAEAATLYSKVQDAIAQYGADKVAWSILCFEEGKAFFKELEPYDPANWGVRMVETGGMVLCDWVLEPSIAEVCYTGDYAFSDFAPSVSLKTQGLQEKIKAKIGRIPDVYGLLGYDEIWMLALALQAAGKYDADALRAQLPYVFENYFSVIGWAPMDKYGDKSAIDFGIFKVMEIEGTYKWVRVGVYGMLLDQISWLPEPEIIY